MEPGELPVDEVFGIPALPGVRLRIDGERIAIVSVDEKSAPAGLVAGMEITAVNDLVVTTRESLEKALRRAVNKLATRLNQVERTLEGEPSISRCSASGRRSRQTPPSLGS